MNKRQWKKLAMQKLSKISTSASKGDVLLLEFDTDKISLYELQNLHNSIRYKTQCNIICVPKNKLHLQVMSIESLHELRDEIDRTINRKIRTEAEMKGWNI